MIYTQSKITLCWKKWQSRRGGRGDGILQDTFESLINNPPTELAFHTEAILIAMFGPDRRQVTQAVNKYFDFAKTLAGKTPWQLHQIDFEQKLLTFGGKAAQIMTRAHYPLLRDLLIVHRNEIHGTALVTTLAILRYKADKGQLPENLQQIVDTGYLKTIPMDPFSSGPLAYRRKSNDFILYSFGPDSDDDEGTWVVEPRFVGELYRHNGDWIFWPVKKKQ